MVSYGRQAGHKCSKTDSTLPLSQTNAVIKEAGLYIQTPGKYADVNENALVSAISSMTYNTSDLGLTCKIPLQVYQPLLELGLKDFRDLLTRNRKATIMSSEELMSKYGKRVKPRHKIALNRLTMIVNSGHLNLDASKWRSWNKNDALDMKSISKFYYSVSYAGVTLILQNKHTCYAAAASVISTLCSRSYTLL